MLTLLQINEAPGKVNLPDYERPTSSMAPKYLEMLEQHTHVIYPALGILVLVLVLLGIFQALRGESLDGLAKDEYKRTIITELRKHVGGMTCDVLARAIGLDRHKTMLLLEQMQQEHLVDSHVNSHGLVMWKVRGIGPQSSP